jgi:hypothetical protein
MKLLLTLALLALAAPADAQQRPPAATEGPEIVVKGKRQSEESLRSFVESLTPGRRGEQIVRHSVEVCPATLGLAGTQNAAVTARLRRIAEAVGAPLGKPDCKPNLFVIVAEDRAAMVKAIRAGWRDPQSSLVRSPVDPAAPATVLHLEGLLDANNRLVGIRPETGEGGGGYYELEVFGSPRIRPSSSPTFMASVMVVEPAALEGLTTRQLADHAAMRLLARTDPKRLGPASPPSILGALAAPIGSEVPLGLTSWDFAFLKALYGSEGRTYSGQQRRDIADRLIKEAGPARPKRP